MGTAETLDPAAESRAPEAVASTPEREADEAGWRLLAGPPIVALITLIAGLIAAAEAGFPFRDPDNIAALYIVEVGAGVFLLVCLDIYLRARKLSGMRRPPASAWKQVRHERWTPKRGAAIAIAIVSFYVAYLAYRHLKASLPLLREGDLFDSQLVDADQVLFFGNDPWELLHSLFGTGIAAHVLSTFYVAFIVFLPLSLGLALVFAEKLKVSLFYATALSINWILGAATYFMLPALGPVYFDPAAFADLPYTEVTRLQELLMSDRVGFLADPQNGTPQAVAAFASLHVAMSFTALLAAYMMDLVRWVKRTLWAWLVITLIATVYLGWHYVWDDIAGMAIGALALLLAKWLTGFDPRAARDPAEA